jgi:hypothetical protein
MLGFAATDVSTADAVYEKDIGNSSGVIARAEQ